MGKFKFSDMMPNAWFYKLKLMSLKGRKEQSTLQYMKRSRPPCTTPPPKAPKSLPQTNPRRTSCYISNRPETERSSKPPVLIESPRRSKKRSRRIPMKDPSNNIKLVSSVSAGCSCSVWKPDTTSVFPAPAASHFSDRDHGDLCKTNAGDRLNFDRVASWSHFDCKFTSSSNDVIVDMGRKTSIKDFDQLPELELPPILTKPKKEEAEATKSKDETRCPPKRSSPGLHRLRPRANSPRTVSSKKLQAHCNRRTAAAVVRQSKGLSDSFAVVKSSSDPQRDFRDSMVEMIVENDIWASKDLEELLACYLSLNSDEYHRVIVKVFEQIWFELTNFKL